MKYKAWINHKDHLLLERCSAMNKWTTNFNEELLIDLKPAKVWGFTNTLVPMSVCGRNWSEFVCVNGVVTESVKEIYNEWYGWVDVTEMDSVSVEWYDRCKGWVGVLVLW